MRTETKSSSSLPEIWGGIECTINRVGDNYRDQLLYSGHYERPEDIAAFATLGISALRYPLLWEKHQPAENENIDWAWTEQQLNEIRNHGISPIAGLVHHGSGPVFTNLTDKEFPEKLARYALLVAEKFPWIEYFTPVNEPLTTARFSGLYGFWYPHQKSEIAFFRMLLNQVKATILAMRSIRTINPDAKFIQTEDLSYTHSTSLLSYQADFENKRRWLTNDLLCGLVNKKHFFWRYLIDIGIDRKDLMFFLDNKCPPDIIGFNYYVTSERFIDESFENYPPFTHGGNSRHRYADTEAVRQGLSKGLKFLLQEAWERYQLPMAVTECHLSCTREEQLRWFKENWEYCCELRKIGVDVRAITAWSLLGAYDWNSLLTGENNFYETGIFDLSNKLPRPTALAKMVRSIAHEGNYHSPLTEAKGWWHHHERDGSAAKTSYQMKAETAPVIILGKTGTLGRAFEKICNLRSIHYITLSRQEINILNEQSIRSIIQNNKPWAIINATGFVAVDDAEIRASECYDVNAIAPGLLAKIAGEYGVRFVSFSSDLVFNGDKAAPYVEEDMVLPLNVYGRSKAKGEELILSVNRDAMVIRTSAFFSPWDKYNFVYHVLEALKTGASIEMPSDVMISPTYVPDLCHTVMDLLVDEEHGLWHISNSGITTWASFGKMIAARTGYGSEKLIARPLVEMRWKAPRPLYSVLGSEKGIKLPDFGHALDRYFENRTV